MTADSLRLGFGSRVVFDLFCDGKVQPAADFMKIGILSVEKKNWNEGPKYSAPVFRFRLHPRSGNAKFPAGKYPIGRVAKVEGNINDIVIEGLDDCPNHALSVEDGTLYLSW